MSAKRIVENVLGKPATRDIWGAGYFPLLPVTPQDFAIGGVLPAVLYMMRWGYRRGKGRFVETFGKPGAPTRAQESGTITRIAQKLGKECDSIMGFDSESTQPVLGDLLLTCCLENRKHSIGRNEPVIRAYPTHYFSSWLDLPKDSAHLRYVPELLVALLADQSHGAFVERNFEQGKFTPGIRFKDNKLLSLFCHGTITRGQSDNLRSDDFWEPTPVGIDQLLTIRIADLLSEAPTSSSGGKKDIPNQRPAAKLTTQNFLEDFTTFVSIFGERIPRLSLIPLLESCFGLGLTSIFLSTLTTAFNWKATGTIPDETLQLTWPVLVDCSSGEDHTIRRHSETSIDHILDQLDEFAKCVMCMRILAFFVKEEGLAIPQPSPFPKNHLDFLGDILFERHPEGALIRRDLRKKCNTLREELENDEDDRVSSILAHEEVHPAWRLSEALICLMGDKLHRRHYRNFFDSCLMTREPNGFGAKRRSTVQGKLQDRASIILSNTALDYLVHRHLIPNVGTDSPRNLSVSEFIRILRERYGFYIDEVPPGFSIPVEDLLRNRAFLERRLRDLGLFSGVNDAESMKRLRPRYEINRIEGDDNNDN